MRWASSLHNQVQLLAGALNGISDFYSVLQTTTCASARVGLVGDSRIRVAAASIDELFETVVQ